MKRFAVVALLSIASLSAVAEVPQAYETIGESHGIPPVLFYALALTESEGPGLQRPWPWTANVNGQGLYFASREALYRYLDNLRGQGRTSFDIGPGQINWRWNGHRFASLWEATDPYTNLKTAAAMLQVYYRESGSLELAIGRYHAPNDPVRAGRYRERVRSRLALVLEGKR